MFSSIGKRLAVSSLNAEDAILKAIVTLIYDYHILDPHLDEERTKVERYISAEGEAHRIFIKLSPYITAKDNKMKNEIVMLKSTFDPNWNAWKCTFFRRVNSTVPKEEDKWLTLDGCDKRTLMNTLNDIHRNRH